MADIIMDKEAYLKSEEYLRSHPGQRLKMHFQQKAEKEVELKAARQKRLGEHPDFISEKKRWDMEHGQLEKAKVNRSHILSKHQEHLNILYQIEKQLFGE